MKHIAHLSGLLGFVLVSSICGAQVLKPNPAAAKIAQATDVAALHSQALHGKLTPDEKFFTSSALRMCASLRGYDPTNGRGTRPPLPSSDNLAPGPQRDAAVALRKSCVWLNQPPDELIAEAERLKSEAARDRSMPAIGESLADMALKGQVTKAADLALEVLESRDAEAILSLQRYLYADSAHARMREFPAPDPALFKEAWFSFACDNGAECGPDSSVARGYCAFQSRCEAPFYRAERPAFRLTPKQQQELRATYRHFLEDVFAKRQWDRLGIRATRYPAVESTNQYPAHPNRCPPSRSTCS